MFKKYIDYYRDNPRGYWFKRKTHGWGWMPVKLQGWLVVAVAVAIITLGYYIGETDDAPGMILIGLALGIAFIFIFGYWKGEKPKWMWGLPKVTDSTEENKKNVALQFNEAITNRDIDMLATLMTDDHAFIDSANTEFRGKDKALQAWRGFFEAFPAYKNVFDRVETKADTVVMLGHSICPNNKELDGSAIWTAKVNGGKLAEWRVYEDTPENKKHLGILMQDLVK